MVGVLLVNLGTPDAPTSGAVRRYLRQFLSDPRVVELPWLLWQPLLQGVILPLRARRSARAYRSIWTDQGSPLKVYSRSLAGALEMHLSSVHQRRVPVSLAMRHGRPSIEDGLSALEAVQVRSIVVLPLYPQYSATTAGSVYDAVSAVYRRRRWIPHLGFISDYHLEPRYIDALAERIEAHWSERGRGELLLMSFHGLPEKSRRLGDPYHDQCRATARALAERLRLTEGEWMVAFQSRFGPAQWLRPYCAEVLAALPQRGVRSVEVVCPGFAVDCLETLEEIASTDRQVFLDAGGERYHYIPCLNADPAHVEALAAVLHRHVPFAELG